MSKRPEKIELSPDELKSLQARIAKAALTPDDIVVFGKLLSFMIWMQSQLERCQLTINKLKGIIFGCKTEKRAQPTLNKDETPLSDNESLPKVPDTNQKTSTKAKGHGRMSADQYTPDETIEVKHATLKAGDPCPEDCGGKLYELASHPGGVIRIKGQSCVHVVRYQFEKLRCALCGAVFTAEAPKDFPQDKYDAYFKANLVIQKYFMANPFYRQERYQQLLGFPLKDSTQWDLVESVANCAHPVFSLLEKLAANGTHLNHDDTKVRILDVIRANKLEPDKKRKGTFTTCVFAEADKHKICLYYSGTKHSGENVISVLSHRDTNLSPILRMCDALSVNVPAQLETILCHCLVHGRRKFTDIEAFFPEECGYVIAQLALVYKHEMEAKENNLTADERLYHHQTHSAPVMEALKTWMQRQFDEHKIEPNSTLGGAIRYMQKHWVALTQFLRIAGANIDNNLVERSLKLAIRTRKCAMFHKSLHGAYVAAMLLSIIATCELANKNPVHYLVALQDHKSNVFKDPKLWLPWNYESTLMQLKKEAA